MRPTRRLFLFTFAIFALLFAGMLTLSALAQTNTPSAIGDTAATIATPFIVAMAVKYPWVVTVLSVIAVLRIVFKPFMTFVEGVVKATPGTSDDLFLAKCEGSVWYRWLIWVLDWLGSIKPPSASTTNPMITKGS